MGDASRGRGRPLTTGGVIDTAALHVIDASCAVVALAASDDEVAAERRRIIKQIAGSLSGIDAELRVLRSFNTQVAA